MAQEPSRERISLLQAIDAALEHDVPTSHAGAGTYFDHVISSEDDPRGVLHHKNAVATPDQTSQDVEQPVNITLMQSDRGFVQKLITAVRENGVDAACAAGNAHKLAR